MSINNHNNVAELVTTNNSEADSIALLALCKASADKLRLDILRVLSHDSFGVLELCSIFNSKQSGMSHHLKILANAGLVTTRREGNSIFYRRAHRNSEESLNTLQQSLFSAIDHQPMPELLQQQVTAVQLERGSSSKQFFSENADKFKQQQEQIAAYELYGPNTIELLSKHVSADSSVLEVGPGEGAFLAELAPRFQQVYALDNSRAMLDKAEAFAHQHKLSNINFIHDDTKASRLQPLQIDCAVVNMVLHHIPSPAEIFLDLAALLAPDGQLFITDLCSHDQSWARESCGDVWLGFDPEDLTEWAANAGFKTGESMYLAQRNGFRVQIRQFIKVA